MRHTWCRAAENLVKLLPKELHRARFCAKLTESDGMRANVVVYRYQKAPAPNTIFGAMCHSKLQDMVYNYISESWLQAVYWYNIHWSNLRGWLRKGVRRVLRFSGGCSRKSGAISTNLNRSLNPDLKTCRSAPLLGKSMKGGLCAWLRIGMERPQVDRGVAFKQTTKIGSILQISFRLVII